MTTSTEIVWVSRAFMDSSLVKRITSDLFESDTDKAVEAMKGNEKGLPYPSERFPDELYAKDRGKKLGKQPDIFNGGSYWIVSAACADVLRQFDLGDGALYPTKLLQHDRITPVEGEYFCLNFGNQKQAFVPEYSPEARKPYASHNIWRLRLTPKDGDIAVTPTALNGPDLWVDPDLWDAFFLSDPLVQALKAAKLTRRFGLRKCRVIRVS